MAVKIGLVEIPGPVAGRPQNNTAALIRQPKVRLKAKKKELQSRLLLLSEEAILILNIFFCN